MTIEFKLSDEDFERIRGIIREELQNMEIHRIKDREEQDIKDTLTIADTAELLSWSRSKVNQEIKNGLPHHRKGGRIIILKDELIEWIRKA